MSINLIPVKRVDRPTYLPIGQQHLLQISAGSLYHCLLRSSPQRGRLSKAPAMIEFEVEATRSPRTRT